MANREIIAFNEVGLYVNEEGDFIITKPGFHSYKLRPHSRTWDIIRILDIRCCAQERRYASANEIINILDKKLSKIENSKLYKFLHKLGLL